MREEKLELGGRPFACADIWILYKDHEQEPYAVRKEYRDTDMARKVAERENTLYSSGISGPFAEVIETTGKSLTLRFIRNSSDYNAAILMEAIADLHNHLSALDVSHDTVSGEFNFDFFNPMDVWFEKVIAKVSRISGYVTRKEIPTPQLTDIFGQLVSQRKTYIHGDICPNNIRQEDGQIYFIDFECLSLGPIEPDVVLPYKMLLPTETDYHAYERLAQIYGSNGMGKLDKKNLASSMIFDLFRRINCYAEDTTFDLTANAKLLEELLKLQGMSAFADMPEGNPYIGQVAFMEWMTS